VFCGLLFEIKSANLTAKPARKGGRMPDLSLILYQILSGIRLIPRTTLKCLKYIAFLRYSSGIKKLKTKHD